MVFFFTPKCVSINKYVTCSPISEGQKGVLLLPCSSSPQRLMVANFFSKIHYVPCIVLSPLHSSFSLISQNSAVN